MTVEANKDTVRGFLDDVMGKGNLGVIDDLCTPDVINHSAVPERRHGVDGMKAVIGFSRAAQPDQHWSFQRLIAEDDYVVVHGVREGTWQGEGFRGLPTPQGQRIAIELVHIFRLQDAKIVEHWAVRDDLGLMQQLGVLPKA